MRSPFFKDYQTLIDEGQLTLDRAQHDAAEQLDVLSCALTKAQSFGIWRWLRLRRLPRRRDDTVSSSVYLWGGVGRGKSMLMDLFFDALPMGKKKRVHFLEFMQTIHEALRVLREENDGDPIMLLAQRIAQETELLCLDEFQVHDIADASILRRLFTALLDQGLIFVATSNRAPDDLYRGGLHRERFLPFIELLKNKAQIVFLGSGMDYRREAMIGTERYHINNPSALNEAFKKLTCGRSGPCSIEVHGREIAVLQQAMGVARFHFDDLCVRPLGGADYLALARTFHTILLDGIPVLTESKRNEAKRFVHLIDALYDNKVLLIANAAAHPDRLYIKGDGEFEFARAASRLNEMQSSDYMPQKAS